MNDKKLDNILIRCTSEWKEKRRKNRLALIPRASLSEYIREMVERGEEYTEIMNAKEDGRK